MPRGPSSAAPKPNTYEHFAAVYDELWPISFKAWAPARKRMLRSVLPRVQSVCELGCGTGVAALDFARRGMKVFAIDFSAAMCRVTREKVRKSGADVKVWRADMRSFRLPEPVDLVSCQWGVVNHLPRRSDLPQAARAVSRALRPGGYFYFDVHRERLFEKQWTITDYGESSRFFAVQRGGYDARRRKGWSHVTWFVKGSGGIWKRFDDLAEEIGWSHAEIVRALRRAGLEIVGVSDFADLSRLPTNRPTAKGIRTMYLARKVT